MPEIIAVALLLVLGIGAYWAMVLFPKQREFQKRQQLASTMVAGDEVITFGGVIGKIVQVDSETGLTHLEIADGVVVRVITDAVMQLYDPESISSNARRGLGQIPE